MAHRQILVTVGLALVGMIGLATPQAALAQAAYPSKARAYNLEFARAMDECVGPIVTVLTPGSIGGCIQANSVTDSAIGMSKARLKAYSSKKGVKMLFTAKGITPVSSKVALQITLRTSNTLGTPPGSKTYEDTTIVCGTTPGACGRYFPASSTGDIRVKQNLDQCLISNSLPASLATGNVQFLETVLINCDTGAVLGVPGIVK